MWAQISHQDPDFFFFGYIPEVGLLSHSVVVFLISWETSILFSMMAAPIYISVNSAQVLLFSMSLPTLVQFRSVTQSCATLCDPMNRSMPGLPVHHQLLEFTQTHAHWVGDAIQPSPVFLRIAQVHNLDLNWLKTTLSWIRLIKRALFHLLLNFYGCKSYTLQKRKNWKLMISIMSHWELTRICSCCLVAQSCLTLYDPMYYSRTGSPVHHYLSGFAQTRVHWVGDTIQPSHPLPPPSPFAFYLSQGWVFSNESVLRIRWPKYWSFSFSTSPSCEYSGLISFRIDWFDLLAVQGTVKSLLQHCN